ncbi:uncharacterized protein KNAG_0C02280 [Huiozyma naganishii CBS 8797]|uniref:Uncharacterized protein n=1 Tax=Huiozyma naganishii (strain ATCC MYA-139 / BCRC 22969 / CBS 8797 / KCTC 17520 / NBRC 10181 / NCYC 3082 / Yp74L-3) TaxID=1071383 RepID=J7S4K4_HUIN7|nr:hypothetical protein KNAG_0C02280 [Kazachstania naganishii CBS 8797]CCK69339.1 hypothetical protein KNAG_0C02280 [Kazachstania naganishii CBS 8797]
MMKNYPKAHSTQVTVSYPRRNEEEHFFDVVDGESVNSDKEEHEILSSCSGSVEDPSLFIEIMPNLLSTPVDKWCNQISYASDEYNSDILSTENQEDSQSISSYELNIIDLLTGSKSDYLQKYTDTGASIFLHMGYLHSTFESLPPSQLKAMKKLSRILQPYLSRCRTNIRRNTKYQFRPIPSVFWEGPNDLDQIHHQERFSEDTNAYLESIQSKASISVESWLSRSLSANTIGP